MITIEKEVTPEMAELLRGAAHPEETLAAAGAKKLVDNLNHSVANRFAKAKKRVEEARADHAKAMNLPLQPGILKGDIISGIFEPVKFERGVQPEWPLDIIAPGTEDDHIAYTMPNAGYIPEFAVEGDYVSGPTYRIFGSIDCNLKLLEDARWDIMARLMQIIEAQFVRKKNMDGWHVMLAAAVARNLIVTDTAAAAGLFTRKLLSNTSISMKRNGGGNTGSVRRFRMTHLATSPENIEDMRSWDLTQVDDVTRREMFLMDEDGLEMVRINGKTFISIEEFGESQEFQNYFTADAPAGLGQSMTGSKLEISLAFDLNREFTNFVMPYRGENRPLLFNDPVLHRQQRFGLYGWAEQGFIALDSRSVLLTAN